MLVEAILGRLAEDAERNSSEGETLEDITLSDLSGGTVNLLTWYLQHRPGDSANLLGAICLKARVRLGLAPAQVGSLLRRSFHLDSGLDGQTIDTLLDMALPPSAAGYRKR